MKKSDLKTGMMVVTRDNDEYMVMLNVEFSATGSKPQNFLVAKDGWMPLSKYSDDLKLGEDEEMPELDIVAVYSPLMEASLWRKNLSDTDDWECVWKREEQPVEMTVAEIEEKLGIKNLKIIKEHEDE